LLAYTLTIIAGLHEKSKLFIAPGPLFAFFVPFYSNVVKSTGVVVGCIG